MTDRYALAQQHCKPLKGPMNKLAEAQVSELIAQLPGWTLIEGQLSKQWAFKDFEQVISFVNLVAWLAQRENHHPDVVFGFNRVRVAYSTHDVKGLSMNDFVCAAKIEALRDL